MSNSNDCLFLFIVQGLMWIVVGGMFGWRIRGEVYRTKHRNRRRR